MTTIYKYKLEYKDTQDILIPEGYKILSVGIQQSDIYVWVMVDTDKTSKYVTFRIAGTGEDISSWYISYNFIGTVQLYDCVWHIFY